MKLRSQFFIPITVFLILTGCGRTVEEERERATNPNPGILGKPMNGLNSCGRNYDPIPLALQNVQVIEEKDFPPGDYELESAEYFFKPTEDTPEGKRKTLHIKSSYLGDFEIICGHGYQSNDQDRKLIHVVREIHVDEKNRNYEALRMGYRIKNGRFHDQSKNIEIRALRRLKGIYSQEDLKLKIYKINNTTYEIRTEVHAKMHEFTRAVLKLQ